MKNIAIITIIITIILASCSTTKTNTQKIENIQNQITSDNQNTTNITSTHNQELKNEFSQLKNIIANLNINYSGKNLDDKLDVLLKQSDQGTKLTISGTGTASFKETSNNHIKTLQTQTIKHFDSLHTEQIQEIKSLKTEIKQEITSKEKKSNPWPFKYLCFPIAALIILAFKSYLKPIIKTLLKFIK